MRRRAVTYCSIVAQSAARPLAVEWLRANAHLLTCGDAVEPVTGIEPACPAWEIS